MVRWLFGGATTWQIRKPQLSRCLEGSRNTDVGERTPPGISLESEIIRQCRATVVRLQRISASMTSPQRRYPKERNTSGQARPLSSSIEFVPVPWVFGTASAGQPVTSKYCMIVLYYVRHRQPFKQTLSAPPLPFVDGGPGSRANPTPSPYQPEQADAGRPRSDRRDI